MLLADDVHVADERTKQKKKSYKTITFVNAVALRCRELFFDPLARSMLYAPCM